MSSIGPQLPPHLAKRKRSSEDDSSDSPPTKTSRTNGDEIALDDSGDDSDDDYGPSAPKQSTAAGPARPTVGPTLPPTATTSNAQEIPLGSDSDDDAGPAPPPPAASVSGPSPAPRRVMGPAPPPADLDSRPAEPAEAEADSSDSDSDDDYGPALPGATPTTARSAMGPTLPGGPASEQPAGPKRDDWMLAPPSASSGYRERDPTKIKSRKFASGASATSRPRDGSSGVSSIWTETPEEKAKRLADAVLGRGGGGEVSGPSVNAPAASSSRSSNKTGEGSRDRDQQDRIRTFTEQTRGKSLYEEHQSSRKAGKEAGKDNGKGDDEDDDPSKRAFDREKDMGLGMKITASQRKELLNRASDFGGRFQKGSYL